MDLVQVVRVLWDRRGWLLAAAVAAIVAGLVVGFKPSFSPPSLETRSSSHGTATTKLLVDTKSSALTDSRRNYVPLVTRAGVFAQLVASESVRRLISRYSGIPDDQIATQVPSAAQPVSDQPRQNRAENPAQRSSELNGEGQHYRVDVGVEQDLPTISVATEAPDEQQAVRLATGVAEGLRQYMKQIDRGFPQGRTVQLRRLGRPVSGTVSGRTGITAAAAVAIVAFAMACLAILAAARFTRRWADAGAGSFDSAAAWGWAGGDELWQCSVCGKLSSHPGCPDHPAAPVRRAETVDGPDGGAYEARLRAAGSER